MSATPSTEPRDPRPVIHLPEPPPGLTPEQFREMLAGVTVSDEPQGATDAWRSAGARLVALAARHFNREELDPITLWMRIESGMRSALAKSPDGEPDRLVSALLEHIRADAGYAIGDPETGSLIRDLRAQSAAWRSGFVAYLSTALYAAMVAGRELHESRRTPA